MQMQIQMQMQVQETDTDTDADTDTKALQRLSKPNGLGSTAETLVESRHGKMCAE